MTELIEAPFSLLKDEFGYQTASIMLKLCQGIDESPVVQSGPPQVYHCCLCKDRSEISDHVLVHSRTFLAGKHYPGNMEQFISKSRERFSEVTVST